MSANKIALRCNLCGKEIQLKDGVAKEDYLHIRKNWGYFSNKDGKTHDICVCENCYDKWVKSFKYPLSAEETIELI